MRTVDSEPTEGAIPRWKQLIASSEIQMPDADTWHVPAPTASSVAERIEQIRQGLVCLTEPGQVIELRILGFNGKRRTDSGYFDDPGKLAKAAVAYDGKVEGLYFTLNPVQPALIARASNRIREYADHATSDADVVRRITLPIDFDPVRPAGISSTNGEHQAALERAWACRAWLAAQGWPEPVFASSGNGAHLLYVIDLPNTARSSSLIKNCLLALSLLFSDDQVKVDTSTSNAARIFKLYGTLARKGDNTPERPHRRSAILAAPAQRQIVSHTQLEGLATQAPRPERAAIKSLESPSGDEARTTAYGKAALDKELAILAATREDRNIQLFQSAAALFSLVAGKALGRAEVWQALLDTAHQIGLPDIEARRTIASAERHGQSRPRTAPDPAEESVTGRSVTSPANRAAGKTPTPEQRLMHVDDLDNLPPIRWLIQDILPTNSLIELHGAPAAGKTQVIFDMAQTLAAGGQTVIYVVGEGLQGYRARKRAWQQLRKQSGGNLFIWPQAVHLFEPQAVRAFVDAIQPKQPAMVVFDTLSRCSLGADENNQKDMGFILDSLDTVRRETGAAVVAVHHTNAAGARERGSSVIRGGMDVMIEVSKEDDLIAVSCSKMKDAGDFEPIYLKPILVDIGEERPVPVLVAAEKRTQTRTDKLTPLQLDILKAIGMEMFDESGISSRQLDELLPPDTKRASKYHSLNVLIRLGYVNVHTRGDPYRITDTGRLKLSNTENGATAPKSNESNPSPNPFIWTLVDPGLMSSPIPHTCRCGMDQTLDTDQLTEQANTSHLETTPEVEAMSKPVNGSATGMSNVQTPSAKPAEFPEWENWTTTRPMAPFEIARYARQIGIDYPTTNGPDLYRIAALIPRPLRAAFEAGLGDAVNAYFEEVGKQGHEPAVQPVPDVLALYLLPGLVSAEELYVAYQRARASGYERAFEKALGERSKRALEVLSRWLQGSRSREAVNIPRSSEDVLA